MYLTKKYTVLCSILNCKFEKNSNIKLETHKALYRVKSLSVIII